MSKKSKSVSLRDDQIEKIEGIEEEHPTLKGEGFSAVLRWLIDLGLLALRQEKERGEGENETIVRP